MDLGKKYVFLVLALVVLLVGVSTVSAENKTYDTASAFIKDISNLQDNTTVIIHESETTYSNTKTISANNIIIKADGLVTFYVNKGVKNYLKITGNNVTLEGIKFSNSWGASAITWNGANGNINNCTFTNNKGQNGGAVTWNGANGTITNSIFIKNIATSNGGAIYWNNGANGRVEGCTFTENQASNGAGAIYWNGANGTVNNTLFEYSKASAGGALIWNTAEGTISNSVFVGCVANSGSAMYIRNMARTEEEQITLIDDDFTNCESTGRNRANIVNCAPNLNIIGGSGALIYLEGNTAGISSPVIVKILNNKTVTTNKGQKNNITATVTVDGENNTVMNLPLNFIIDGTKIAAVMENGAYTATYTKNTNGNTIVMAECEQCSNAIYETGALNIAKENTTLDVKVKDITYGDDLDITVNVNPNATGNITIFINNEEIETQAIKDGIAKFSIQNLNAGNYNLIVKYSGDEKFIDATNALTFNVNQIGVKVKINTKTIKEGEDAPVDIIITDENGNLITAYITIKIDGQIYAANVKVINGTLSLILSGLGKGDHNIEVEVGGNLNLLSTNSYKAVNGNYKSAVSSSNIHVDKKKVSFWKKVGNAFKSFGKKVSNMFNSIGEFINSHKTEVYGGGAWILIGVIGVALILFA